MNKQNDSWSLRINIRSSGQEKGSGSILSKLNIALSVVLWLGWAKKIQLTRGVSVSTEVTGKILSTMRILLVPHKNPEYQVVIWINIDSRRTACGWHFHSVSKWTTQSCRQIFRVSHWIESSFQLLKLENLLRWSFFTLIYNRSSNIWIISYILHIRVFTVRIVSWKQQTKTKG